MSGSTTFGAPDPFDHRRSRLEDVGMPTDGSKPEGPDWSDKSDDELAIEIQRRWERLRRVVP